MDDFYQPPPSHASPPGLIGQIWSIALGAPLAAACLLLVTPVTLVLATRWLSERKSRVVDAGKNERSVWMLPYWFPGVGHGFSFIWDPAKLMTEARDMSAHGIFALRLGPSTHNIVSNPGLIRNVMSQRESTVAFQPIAFNVVEKAYSTIETPMQSANKRQFFDFPKSSKPKYAATWEEFNSFLVKYLMREPYLGIMLKATITGIEAKVPQMISFMESPIDQESWERWADAEYISSTETEINLMALMRDMMGQVSVPAMYGRNFLEQNPEILHDLYAMDLGMPYFLAGLPRWTPIPAVTRAHMARSRVWWSLIEYHKALDAYVDGQPLDSSWGDLEDVSALTMARHKLFKDHGFTYGERGDISILWALVVNANLLVYWHLHHVLAVPGLVARLRAEIAPYAVVEKPVSIGGISEAPRLQIAQDGLAKHCPLLKSTYLEALRMSSQPWSVRELKEDVSISTGATAGEAAAAYVLRKGEYVTMPHDIHMRDAKYFQNPERFEPERFLVTDENGKVTTDMGTIRPFGGGPSHCKGRIFAERECLSLVAGVLAYWDIEPAGKKATWQIPKQKKTSAVSLPVHDTRVRIRRRKFEWDA
ncbi:cytochrome P450-6 [Coleophoma cylindrospora]|uniref:Cytochrome P450-6 n=1 Tax=Coleophoma cylindrospora TaxID=1849047 RepID=A0A3D8SSV1_9HELO|nr:cytochrome P450-6 [Coleophoma cylindrospora]